MKIIKEELQFEENLKRRLEFICEFSIVSPTFINESIRKNEKTNLSYEIAKENRSLKYQLEQKDNEIDDVKYTISKKGKIIDKLRTKKDKLKEKVNKFKGFWKKL